MTCVVLVTFRLHPLNAPGFVARVRRQAADSLVAEPECTRFDVCLDPRDPTTVVLYEVYTTPADFDRHLESDHFLAFDAEVALWVADKQVAILTLDNP